MAQKVEHRFLSPDQAAAHARELFVMRFNDLVTERMASVPAGQPVTIVLEYSGETYGFGSLTKLQAQLRDAGWASTLDNQGKALYIEPAEPEP